MSVIATFPAVNGRWPRLTSLSHWVPLVVFMVAVLINANQVGIYMDAVNPGFMAAQWLHRGHNPGAGLPSKVFPILGSLYHGMQNAYAGLLVFPLLGFNPASLRFEQAIFGVILIAAFTKLTYRLVGSQVLAWVAGLGLATELAFTASFLTQFYIVVGGAAWLFVSLLLALPAAETSWIVKRRLFWSGVFSGLAVYGYFVLAFFIPATLMFALLRGKHPARELRTWISGLVVGMLPFALGYLSLFWKLHGVASTQFFVQNMLGQLKPFDSVSGPLDGFVYAWDMVHLVATDRANESMLLGEAAPPGYWAEIKFSALVATSIGLMASAIYFSIRGDRHRLSMASLAFLPACYVAVASLFGHRLWAHHFSVLVPFIYLLPCLAIGLLRNAWRSTSRAGVYCSALAAIVLVAANVQQQAVMHERLRSTGGSGKASDALTVLAMDAKAAPENVAYIFPEWGFFSSFCFLTGNRVHYAVDAAPETLRKLRKMGVTDFRLVFWNASNEARYRQSLSTADTPTITLRQFTTRDGFPAFQWLRAAP